MSTKAIYFYTNGTKTIPAEDGFSQVIYTVIKVNGISGLTVNEMEYKARKVALEHGQELNGIHFNGNTKSIRDNYTVIECN